MMQWFDSMNTWLQASPQWLALAIFLVACLECLAIAGIIIPGTVLLFTLAALAGNGALELWQTLLLAYAGGLLGDAISYTLGRRFHQGIRRLPVLREHPEWLIGAENYFQRYGVISLLVGRYIGPLRPMLPLVAGMLDMPAVRFALVSMLAAAGWAVAYMLPGWATGAALRLPLPEGFWGAAGIVCAGLAVVLLLIIQASLRERRWAASLAALLGAIALAALLIGFPHLDSLDQGLMALVQDERSRAFDAIAVLITRLGDFHVQLATGTLLTVLLLAAGRWQAGLFVTGSLLLAATATTILKHLLERTRPDVLLHPLESYSLPSGHTSAAFAFFLALGVLAGRGSAARTRLSWLVVATLPALAIALSRVYLGVHWPSDIIAGVLVALTSCALSLALVQRAAPMQALPARVWWLVIPACAALFGAMVTWELSAALLRYRY
ncbi:bifunctional DedA family/phosphatase PAP2 family protein [Ectopseudomonas oleovorans]|uniref:Bifunctional DedA family/phosphatase PAP2 family protein n=1 Tax=Ectopseudomonas oleovorans TaxID=301 RepID=A0AA42TYK1_ECTOL|nr:bifunctional DedA family/phosphatase PAP2 family protein [Pseudomonas oleovorans]MDH1338493.1 bifunctional DedA family/phosphatase PAP2 family protein [Pseudomonas oleovorans]MDH1494276.1 bifunctional DedA family/phosphatase PAP2 family protein [Pseudomonas oleovorans]WGG20409.1 bifunctional DedA family/phosphatase PAP2 family protein [Pseudomonas oleovorans]